MNFDLARYEAEFVTFLNGVSDKYMVTSAQAARIIGVSLRTVRNWEQEGKMPPREPEGHYRRRYKLVDIKKFARRYRQIQALLAIDIRPDQLVDIFGMSLKDQRKYFLGLGAHPSLWP